MERNIHNNAMEVIWAKDPFPNATTYSIFLAGPTPRSKGGVEVRWRSEALRVLREELHFTGHVYVPEESDGSFREGTYNEQVVWEEEGLNRADVIVFWVPRKMEGKMPGLTTNDEWGTWKHSRKVVWGSPPDAENVRYQIHYAQQLSIPHFDSLHATLKKAIEMFAPGEKRQGSYAKIPLLIYKTPAFRVWKHALEAAGNEIRDARVKWVWPYHSWKDSESPVFLFALHAKVWITSEKREKVNELVLSRPDVSAVMMWSKGLNLGDCRVVLVKEFRTPVSNPTGFVWELPGGSTTDTTQDALAIAAEELFEETSERVAPTELVHEGVRQCLATLASHRCNLFSIEISNERMTAIDVRPNKVHGKEEDSERTEVHVVRIEDILEGKIPCDWSTVGMIMKVLSPLCFK